MGWFKSRWFNVCFGRRLRSLVSWRENIFFVGLREHLGAMVLGVAPFPEPWTRLITEARNSNDEQKRKSNISIWRERISIYPYGSQDDSRSVAMERHWMVHCQVRSL